MMIPKNNANNDGDVSNDNFTKMKCSSSPYSILKQSSALASDEFQMNMTSDNYDFFVLLKDLMWMMFIILVLSDSIDI